MNRLLLFLFLIGASLAVEAAQYPVDVTWDVLNGPGVTNDLRCATNAAPSPTAPPVASVADTAGAATFTITANGGETLRCTLQGRHDVTGEVGPLSEEGAATVPFRAPGKAPTPRITIRAGS